MNALLQALVDDLDSYTEGLVDGVAGTFGEPSAPVGTNCLKVYAWLDRVDPREQPPACMTLTRLTYAWRVYACYPVSDKDLTADQHEDRAEVVLGIVEAIWCGLVRGKATKELMGLGTCSGITIGPALADAPLGGVVSYTGSVIVDWNCPAVE